GRTRPGAGQPLRAAAAGLLPGAAGQERPGAAGAGALCEHLVRLCRGDGGRAGHGRAVPGRAMEGAMSGEKTEQPTQKRLREARGKGDVAYSKDFTQTLLVLALLGYLLANGQGIFQSLGRLVLAPAELVAMPF